MGDWGVRAIGGALVGKVFERLNAQDELNMARSRGKA